MTTEKALVESDEKKQQFAGLILLDRIITNAERIHSSFMEKDNKPLEPFLNILENRGLLKVDEENYFVATEKGKELYQTLLDQRSSYVTHFEIYSHVNLEEGTFAEKETDFLDDDSWTDLRVAVAEFKGIDPYRIVLLAMLSDETFFENPDWKFDLAMGSLFEDLEEITQTQVTEEELAYEDEEGFISGHDVLADVISQGTQLNQKRIEEQRQREAEEEYVEETITIVEEDVWQRPYW